MAGIIITNNIHTQLVSMYTLHVGNSKLHVHAYMKFSLNSDSIQKCCLSLIRQY